MLQMKNIGKDYWSWLVHWTKKQIDGDWENEHGVRIEILDNPGWLLSVDIVSYEPILYDIDLCLSLPDSFLNIKIKDAYLYISTGLEHLSLLPYIFYSIVSYLEEHNTEGSILSLEELKKSMMKSISKILPDISDKL